MEFGKKNTAGQSVKKKGGFAAAMSQVTDPLADVVETGVLEQDAVTELTELQRAYRERAKREQDRHAAATDSEFWFAVCFKDRDAKEKFLAQVGANRARLGDKYLDGHKLAKMLGYDLT